MKDDLPPCPPHPPAKRRVLQDQMATPDLWLAMWAGDDTLTPSERRRVQEERNRRKALVPDLKVGLLVGPEGVTPGQFTGIGEQLAKISPTEIHHPGVASKLHTVCRSLGVPVRLHVGDLHECVRAATIVVAAPRSPDPKSPVMENVRYARHRSLPVVIVLPGGEIQ